MSITGLSGVFGLHRQVGRDMPARGPYNAGVGSTGFSNTVQQLLVEDATDGTFKLKFRGLVTADIDHDASNSDIESALESLTNIGGGNVTVTGSGGDFTISFAGGDYEGYTVGVEVHEDRLEPAGVAKVSVNTTEAGTTTGGGWAWLPATTVNFQPNQIVQAIPPEVGGTLFSRGSYKGGISGQGQVMLIPRGGVGLAELLLAFTGTPIVEGDATAYNNGTANKLVGDGNNGLPVGVFKYRFIPGSGSTTELPWYTIVRNVGGVYVEEFSDARLGNFAFDIAATNLLTIDAGFVARKVEFIAKGTGAATDVGVQVAQNGKVFQSVDATMMLDSNAAGTPGPVQNNELLKPTRLNIAFANQLSQNEFVVGSHFLQDVTNLARTANVTMSCYLTSPEIYARAYAHGADITQGAAWSSEIWKGALEVGMTGGIITGSTRYALTISLPEMDYMAAPIQLAGNNLVEYQLTTNVVVPENPANHPFVIEYVTDEDILY